jgi:hypothetical protein
MRGPKIPEKLFCDLCRYIIIHQPTKPLGKSRMKRSFLSSMHSSFTTCTFVYVTLALVVASCSGAPASNREAGAVGGAALGAGTGAIVGSQVGHTGGGAAIGAAAGAVAGAVVGDANDNDQEAYVKQRQEVLRLQQKDIERQQREIDDLRRQELHDASLRRYENAQ